MVKALQECGRQIPDDIGIITFNNTSFLEFSNPPLSSVEVFLKESAECAVLCMNLLWDESGFRKRLLCRVCWLIVEVSEQENDLCAVYIWDEDMEEKILSL
ncbi:hypothetical protein DXA07_07950 [Clostridium sp. AM54-37XD]|nr:hypothetical protein DXA07_07950 [Clostridium sp. AM54-37XD]